jgi:hypothetical protein
LEEFSMRRQSIRLFIAILTFTFGILIFKVSQVGSTLVGRLLITDNTDVSPITLPRFNSDAEANEVYRLLVHREFIRNDEVKLIVIQAETTGCPMYEDESVKEKFGVTEPFHQMMSKTMPEAEVQTLDNYLLSNKGRQELKVWNLGVNYLIVRNSELPDSNFENFWDRFYRRYPNSPGLLFFSKVGFNDRHDQAFLYMGRSCGGLCGGGEYVLLNKVNGEWVVSNEQELWVS